MARRRDSAGRGGPLGRGAHVSPLPVLCYHRVGGPLELGVTRVGRTVFARQMTALARAGWRTLTLDEFAERSLTRQSAIRNPQSAFLLTFDDGYASLAHDAYPVLAELGFTATTFLITDHVGANNTWDVRYTWRPLARVAHRLPCTPHLAGRRPRGRRAEPRPASARPPAGRLGGTRRRLSIRGGGRAGPAAGAERGLRARLLRSAGERRCDERAAGSGLRMGRRERATGAAGGWPREPGTIRRPSGESVRGGDLSAEGARNSGLETPKCSPSP